MNRKEKIIDYIQKHPDLSGNQIYIYSKDNGFGINKQEFYKLFRESKQLPKPTKEKKLKSIPKKHRTEQQKETLKEIKKEKKELEKIEKISKRKTPIKFPTKDGIYGIVEVKTKNSKRKDDKNYKASRWIKYTDQADLQRQLDILDESDKKRGYSKPKYELKFRGFRKLTEFIDEEFMEIINS